MIESPWRLTNCRKKHSYVRMASPTRSAQQDIHCTPTTKGRNAKFNPIQPIKKN
jgi:hypothetical protein